MDDHLKQTFAATKLGAVSGPMYLGGKDFEGHIDQFAVFEQALPKSLLESFGTISPSGDEMGLMAYLPFQEMKENGNGIYEQVFSVNDQRIRTVNGTVVDKKNPVVLDDPATLHPDRTQCAPVSDMGKLTKMNFDWAFNGDELLVNLNMQDREINKQTIYVTVRDVEDLNGRTTANSPSSTYAAIAESYGATVTSVSTLTETIELLEQGRVDATINAQVSIQDYLDQHPDANIKVVAVLDGDPVAYPVRGGADTETLIAAIDDILEQARQDGTLSSISEKYFGLDLTQPD